MSNKRIRIFKLTNIAIESYFIVINSENKLSETSLSTSPLCTGLLTRSKTSSQEMG